MLCLSVSTDTDKDSSEYIIQTTGCTSHRQKCVHHKGTYCGDASREEVCCGSNADCHKPLKKAARAHQWWCYRETAYTLALPLETLSNAAVGSEITQAAKFSWLETAGTRWDTLLVY